MKTDKNGPADPMGIAQQERERILDVLAHMTRTNSRYGTAYYVPLSEGIDQEIYSLIREGFPAGIKKECPSSPLAFSGFSCTAFKARDVERYREEHPDIVIPRNLQWRREKEVSVREAYTIMEKLSQMEQPNGLVHNRQAFHIPVSAEFFTLGSSSELMKHVPFQDAKVGLDEDSVSMFHVWATDVKEFRKEIQAEARRLADTLAGMDAPNHTSSDGEEYLASISGGLGHHGFQYELLDALPYENMEIREHGGQPCAVLSKEAMERYRAITREPERERKSPNPGIRR